jgi:hypothetical protein
VIVAVLWVWFITSTIANFWQIGFASGSTAAGPPLGQRTSIMVSDFGAGIPVAMAVSAHLKKGQGDAD